MLVEYLCFLHAHSKPEGEVNLAFIDRSRIKAPFSFSNESTPRVLRIFFLESAYPSCTDPKIRPGTFKKRGKRCPCHEHGRLWKRPRGKRQLIYSGPFIAPLSDEPPSPDRLHTLARDLRYLNLLTLGDSTGDVQSVRTIHKGPRQGRRRYETNAMTHPSQAESKFVSFSLAYLISRCSLTSGMLMAPAKIVPLPVPTGPVSTPADIVAAGPMVPPIDRIKIFSPQQWEDFTHEWANSLHEDYSGVEKCGGPGDMGRDVIASCKGNNGAWHNYQCKHYDHPLAPSDIWSELGKLVYYTFIKEYAYPQRYFFIAPQGAGTKLSNLLKKPIQLRADLIAAWNGHCREKITSTMAVELDPPLKSYLESLDFSIFEAVPALKIIDGHAKTKWFTSRFGGGLPTRPPISQPPTEPAAIEAKYVRHLLDAYGDHLKHPLADLMELAKEATLHSHFGDARIEFYSAESLRAFSRDTLPPGEFEKLQDEIHSGIKDEIRTPHSDGYQRVLAVIKTARTLPLAAHALHSRLTVRDHGGICHQLANDDKVKWVP